MNLNHFKIKNFDRGRPFLVEALWLVIRGILFSTWIPGSGWRCLILRGFGARIGKNVNIKPYVRIKFPWKLRIGDFSWVGENAWIDNLAEVHIGSNVCVSQGVYICTGNHDYKKESFDLITSPVVVEDGSWLCAFSKIAPGVTIKRNSVVGFGSVVVKNTEEDAVYSGNPAVAIRKRNS